MESKCYNCDCNNRGLTTVPHCHDSFPSCTEVSPCSEFISDMCVLHTPNAFVFNPSFSPSDTITISNNIPLYNLLQLLFLSNSTLQSLTLDNHLHGPILGLRADVVGQTSFRIRWEHPRNIPSTATYRVRVEEVGNTANNATFTVSTTENQTVISSYLQLNILPNKTYSVFVSLFEPSSGTLTRSITILVKTKS